MENRGLFKIDDTGEKLIINKIEALEIPEFKEIIRRDKGSDGDYDGRKKFFAFKELMYIYLIADPLSILRDEPVEERKELSKKKSKLPSDWKEDDLVRAGIIEYEATLHLTGAEYAYFNASRSLYSMGKDIELFNMSNEMLRKKINKLKAEIDGDNYTPDEVEQKEYTLQKSMENLSNNTQEIIKLNNLLPKAYKSLEELYENMKKGEEGKSKLYGGGELGRREE